MRRLMRSPASCMVPGNRVLADLMYGWGNEGWSAREDFLIACVEQAMSTTGPILECGCGLSTIVVGSIARRRGKRHWALEHLPAWTGKVRRRLDRYGLQTVTLYHAPLVDYGEFHWYDVRQHSLPPSFALVICDGPPGGTPGGRYGLVPVMHDRLAPGCVILLDDAGRDQELEIAHRWSAELGARVEAGGSGRTYAKLTVVGKMLSASA
ncbi:MAG TPA: class I SAM-dependent methyltransferase [Gemmatimonadaceae bacterium]|nr:class I SAM-dependent methyltransferase [Gemmatimonadaceae bacterium]